MSRTRNKLTARTVETKRQPGYFSDGGNLYLRVTKALSKSWAFYYTKEGRRVELGLGAVTEVTLEEARHKAHELRKLIAAGVDPLKEKQRQLEAEKLEQARFITFKQCAERYLDAHRPGWKNPKHAQQWANTLSQYVYPYFGDIHVKDVDTALITKCLGEIWLTKNETAGRVRGRIESVLDWAKVNGHRQGDNPAQWRGHLDKLLASPSKVQKTEHHSALPYAETPIFLAQLREQDGIAARCLEFTILTAARTGESIGATWEEIDLDAKIWTIPAHRMKAAKEHRVPLSDHAMTILTAMAAIKTNQYVFAGSRKGLSNMAMLQLLKRMERNDLTVHGFRSTFRDWAAESTAYAGEVVEMALAHKIINLVEAAYRRGDLLDKRTLLMADWGRFVCGLVDKR